MSFAREFVQPLESRTLLSASVSPFNAAIVEDRLQIRLELLQLKADIVAGCTALLTEGATLRADGVGQNATLAPLFATLHTDATTWQLKLASDRLDEASNVVADEQAIVQVQLKMLADKGNPTAITADKAQIKADRIQMQTDMVAGLNQRITDRQSFQTQLFADCQAITDALGTPGISTQMAADVTTWVNSRETLLTTITTDLQTLEADRQQLITDLTASENA